MAICGKDSFITFGLMTIQMSEEIQNEVCLGRGGNLVRWQKMVETVKAVCQLTLVSDPSEEASVHR